MTTSGRSLRRPAIRPAQAGEAAAAAAVTAVAYAAFRTYEPLPVWNAYVDRSSDPARGWDGAELLVAEEEGALLGCVAWLPRLGGAGLGLPPDWGGLRRLAVLPGARRRGLGAALVAACLDRARAAGVATVGLHAAPELAAAVRLYGRMGFRRAPAHDCFASEELGFGPGRAPLLAFRMEPAGRAPRR